LVFRRHDDDDQLLQLVELHLPLHLVWNRQSQRLAQLKPLVFGLHLAE
jgi:hypothetical protein